MSAAKSDINFVMIKRIFITVFGLFVVIGALGAVVQTMVWEQTLDAIGTLESAQGVMLTADLSGRVTRLNFQGGERVTAGDIILEQDASTELTQLRAAESDLKLASSNLDRASRLYNNKVVSRSEIDTARSAFQAATAQVDNIRSSITKKQIVAPFAGQLGLRLVDIGQDLQKGVPIASLQSTDGLYVNFALPQHALASVESNLPVRLTTDAAPGMTFEGIINAIDTEVNASTRSIRVQAQLTDTGSQNNARLLPGMYASVQVVLPEQQPVTVIPLTAVSFATFGDSVFIIEENDDKQLVVRQQFVQLGERRGDFVAVNKGLEVDQQIVSEGVFKLRNGAAITINDEGALTPSINPSPDNA